jgi:hypothetical protein
MIGKCIEDNLEFDSTGKEAIIGSGLIQGNILDLPTGTKTNHENHSQDRRSSSRQLNPGPYKHETVLTEVARDYQSVHTDNVVISLS